MNKKETEKCFSALRRVFVGKRRRGVFAHVNIISVFFLSRKSGWKEHFKNILQCKSKTMFFCATPSLRGNGAYLLIKKHLFFFKKSCCDFQFSQLLRAMSRSSQVEDRLDILARRKREMTISADKSDVVISKEVVGT